MYDGYGNLPDWYRGEALVPAEDLPKTSYSTDVITAEAVRFLENRPDSKPLFLYVAYNAPHFAKVWDENKKTYTQPLQAKPEAVAAFPNIANEKRRTYAGMVKAMDDVVGRLTAKISELGLARNTWVIFSSDNGASLGHGGSNGRLRDQKMTLFEGGIRVPGIMSWPGRIRPGQTRDQPASVLDLVPTICAVASADVAGCPVDGVDLGPVLFQGRSLDRDLFFFLDATHLAFRRGPWKYLRDGKLEYLFNLSEDLAETRNLAVEKPDKVRELREAHSQTLARINQNRVGR